MPAYFLVNQIRLVTQELSRTTHEAGTAGRFGGQAVVEDARGVWKELTDNVNTMSVKMGAQVRDIANVSAAIAEGDLSKKVSIEAEGEMMELKQTINTMVDQLRYFATEVSRISNEVGNEGKLGGQADVAGLGGVWRDTTEMVNTMAANTTMQVRDIANVSKAVAKGDLTKKVTVNVKGEILDLKNTINIMVRMIAIALRMTCMLCIMNN